MTREEALEKFRAIFEERTGINEFKEEDKFIDDLGLDSLGIMDVVAGIEEEFDISVPDEDIGKLTTVKSAIEYILEKVK
ncbi:MAG: acyl carrier protein [Caldiserica bacterium]|nr:MAG: acyl carrier protein [Caldisericota bacterium]